MRSLLLFSFLFIFVFYVISNKGDGLTVVDAKTFYPYSPLCEDYEACFYEQEYPCHWNSEICNNGMGSIIFVCSGIPNDGSASLSYNVAYPEEPLLSVIRSAGGGNIEEGFTISAWNVTDDSLTVSDPDSTNSAIMSNWVVAGNAQNRFDTIPLSDQCFNSPEPFAVGSGCLVDDNTTPRTFGPKAIVGNGVSTDIFKIIISRNSLIENRCQTIISEISII